MPTGLSIRRTIVKITSAHQKAYNQPILHADLWRFTSTALGASVTQEAFDEALRDLKGVGSITEVCLGMYATSIEDVEDYRGEVR